MTDTQEFVVQTPLFPSYSEVEKLLVILGDKTTKHEFLNFFKAIWGQTGTPQNPVDWSNPDQWIEERLDGQEKILGKRIWEESNKTVNPRHVYGSYLFISTYELLVTDPSGIYRISDKGKGFLNNEHAVMRELDKAEGLPKLLAILTAHSG